LKTFGLAARALLFWIDNPSAANVIAATR